MSVYTNYWFRLGEIEFANGAKAIVRHATNGFLYLVQTHDSSGSLLAAFTLTPNGNGVFSGGPTVEPIGLWVPQTHPALAFAKGQIDEITDAKTVLTSYTNGEATYTQAEAQTALSNLTKYV